MTTTTMSRGTRFPISRLLAGAALLVGLSSGSAAPAQQVAMAAHGEAAMVMPTDDAKAFRQVRPAVAAVQAKLADLGLFEGRVNGLYGPSTRKAVAAHQRDRGIEATGWPTVATVPALDESPVAIHDSLMRESFRRVPRLIGPGTSSGGVSGPRPGDGSGPGVEAESGASGVPARASADGKVEDAGSREREAGRDTLTLEVAMGEPGQGEFTFSPDTLRLPAGQPVKLVFRNVGQVPHEFMAGRQVEGGDFATDLFRGVPVEISGSSGEMPEGGGHGEDHAHGGEEAEQPHGADEGHEDGHGTMILLRPGESGTMAFTLPASRRGSWQIACFQPGHYEAGMHAVLVVE